VSWNLLENPAFHGHSIKARAIMAAATRPGAEAGDSQREITLISHSTNFYLYPIWLVGFILALVTYLEGGRMAVVPEGTEARRDWRVEVAPGRIETREGLILPASDSRHHYHLPPSRRANANAPLSPPEPPHVRMSYNHWLGTWFVLTILIVFAVTSRGNEPVRGHRLFIGALLIALAVNTLILYREGTWAGFLYSFIMSLHIYINLLDICLFRRGYSWYGYYHSYLIT
jgi:hypothetical protein